MKKWVVIAAAAIAIAIGVVAATQLQYPDTQPGSAIETQDSSMGATSGTIVAIMETAQGSITIQFFPDEAPEHVRSFLDLAEGGFYDGVLFHRLVPGFVIQGGDPLTKDLSARDRWGTGGPGYTLDQEFNDISHSRGVLSMARSSDPNSAGSQFFIVLQDSDLIKSTLDRNYTVFGRVVEGMDVVDRIASLQTVGGLGNNKEQPVNPDDARIIKIRIEQR